ncbi:MAG: hypothetical protein DRQ97_10505 [Gammaproteobacteria bacterium]|nr:MAG: hypothetical protein DRQ97_10505 [Gammaproteobacteria bacterium]
MRLRKCSVKLTVAAAFLGVLAFDTQARMTMELGDGELVTTGYLRNETRWRIEHDQYMTQSINRFQLETSWNFEDKGIFDELSFVTVIRPEYDMAHMNDYLTNKRVGKDATKPSYLGIDFNYGNDPIGYAGFDVAFGATEAGLLSTGGLAKNVMQGSWDASTLQEFEVIAHGSPFPLLAPTSTRNQNCRDCQDVDISHSEIAMANTDASGALYPFRELYTDAVIGDWWLRLGKQQIVWGKTDFFRLQDIINPIDFGQHFFFDQFEDIRIPQWAASLQWKGGSIGPLNDTALQLVWNFDEFRAAGLGNPSAAWAHPFGKEIGTFASFNTYFSPEPCVSAATAASHGADDSTVCQEGDGRLPSGFGIPVGLARTHIPSKELDNTEVGGRFEFRLFDLRFALSHYYGWSDLPVFKFDTINVNAATVPGVTANDALIIGLTDGALVGLPEGSNIEVPVAVMNPQEAIQAAADAGYAPALDALQHDNARLFYDDLQVFGGLTSIRYSQVHTTGLSMDYFDDWTGIVFRVESSYTFDELINNTMKADWIDEGDVLRYSLGLDRPTFIRLLNKDRTFFLSFQFFDTWYLDHEGSNTDGYILNDHNRIYTFYWETYYARDTVKPSGFAVYEEESKAWVFGANVTWFIDNHWSVKTGAHIISRDEDPGLFDVGPFASFTLDGNYAQQAIFGYAREGIGSVKDNDEVFVQVQYQF